MWQNVCGYYIWEKEDGTYFIWMNGQDRAKYDGSKNSEISKAYYALFMTNQYKHKVS